jgi:cytochrome c biogenesis protein CcmG/thiol:disulfide interchange protein DsbE
VNRIKRTLIFTLWLLTCLVAVALGVVAAATWEIKYHRREYLAQMARMPKTPVPAFSLPDLTDKSREIASQSLQGTPYLLSAWASWCGYCLAEHDTLSTLAKRNRIKIIGLNFKDEPEDALQWLNRHGNPYAITLADYSGDTLKKIEIETVPHHILVDAAGNIRWRYRGKLTERLIRSELIPMIKTLEHAP